MKIIATALNAAFDMCEDDNIFTALAGATCLFLLLLSIGITLLMLVSGYLYSLLYLGCGDSFFWRAVCLVITVAPCAPVVMCMVRMSKHANMAKFVKN